MARSGSDSSNSSADSALEENDGPPFKYNPQIWMPVSWHIRGGAMIPPRKSRRFLDLGILPQVQRKP
ncbi:hypothetical protein GYMLUDRAFT_243947 [Collybiopsis luxurians FD-317 M1]|uniref:Uncharacterized protein n=1 Tax=Collybiopsis luxurians FD-317 M1 TaxID=944289 RepID=A0A0D0BAN5_9AGAR|nr:hypothetical protein GYMLUDRAFT_243947 [Collybiopsis luxurians FD-317 M1]